MIEEVDIGTLQKEGKKKLRALFTLIKLSIASPEFRNSIDDFVTFLLVLLKGKSKKLEEKAKKVAPKDDVFRVLNQSPSLFEPKPQYLYEESPTQSESNISLNDHNTASDFVEEKLVNRLSEFVQQIHQYPEYRDAIT